MLRLLCTPATVIKYKNHHKRLKIFKVSELSAILWEIKITEYHEYVRVPVALAFIRKKQLSERNWYIS